MYSSVRIVTFKSSLLIYNSRMVGKDENAILCKRRDSGKHEADAQNGTYSRRLVERKTKFQTDMESDSNAEYLALVDGFVQDVIERAKEQYLSGCANGDIGNHGNSNEGENRLKKGMYTCTLHLRHYPTWVSYSNEDILPWQPRVTVTSCFVYKVIRY